MIDLNITLVVQLAIVLGLMLFLSRLVFKPYLSVLQERKDCVEGAERKARELMQRAEEFMERYREAILAAQAQGATIWEEIRKEGLAQEMEILQKSMEEANLLIKEIKMKISEESEAARHTLRLQAQALSLEMAEKILGRSFP